MTTEESGFNFDNFSRNQTLTKKGVHFPKARKTGTTIAGLVFKNGVILGADTRATEDTIVADKHCMKVHYIADNIYCGGAGTAADTEMVTRMISSKIALHKYELGRTPRVITAVTFIKQHLFNYQGHIGAALIVGGVDSTGPHLYSIAPHGSVDKLPYLTMGSGCLAAIATFENRYKFNMEREEAIQLARDGIAAGILNDLGSGSTVDLCVITKEKTDYLRDFDHIAVKGTRSGNYKFKPGTTAVLKKSVKPVRFDIEDMTIKPLPIEDDDTMR